MSIICWLFSISILKHIVIVLLIKWLWFIIIRLLRLKPSQKLDGYFIIFGRCFSDIRSQVSSIAQIIRTIFTFHCSILIWILSYLWISILLLLLIVSLIILWFLWVRWNIFLFSIKYTHSILSHSWIISCITYIIWMWYLS